MLTVQKLIEILSNLPSDTQVSLSYDTGCGGTDFSDSYGCIVYSQNEKNVDFSCESLDMIEYLISENRYSSDSIIIYSNE